MVKTKSKSTNKSEIGFSLNGIPEGVIVLSVLMFFSSLMSFLLALSMFNVANPASYNQLLTEFAAQGSLPLAASSFIYMGILFIVLGVISYLIGRGLIKLQKRARVALIIVLIAGLVSSLFLIIKAGQYYSGGFLAIVQLIALFYTLRRKVAKVFVN